MNSMDCVILTFGLSIGDSQQISLPPGLQFELGIERQVGYWRTRLSDRMLRFFIWSVVLQTVAAPLTVWVWETYASTSVDDVNVDLRLWIILLLYVFVPLALGLVVGRAMRRGRRWPRWIVGIDPAPTAWDWLWSGEVYGEAYVRVKLKAGGWAAGFWGAQAQGFAASYPAPQDIFLPMQLQTDQRTGEIIVDEDGRPKRQQWGLLIRWDEVDLLEFQEIDDGRREEVARDPEAGLRTRQRQAGTRQAAAGSRPWSGRRRHPVP